VHVAVRPSMLDTVKLYIDMAPLCRTGGHIMIRCTSIVLASTTACHKLRYDMSS